MLAWLRDPALKHLQRFRSRYSGHTLIIHQGFPPEWLEELLKQPGGGGHFRLDARPLPVARPTPVEWIAQTHILPLALPLPLLLKTTEHGLWVRHLCRHEQVVHPSEIAWFLEELEQRYHALLLFPEQGTQLEVQMGIPVKDNEALSLLNHITG